MQAVLGEEDVYARAGENDGADEDDEADDEWKELFSKPIVEKVVFSPSETNVQPQTQNDESIDTPSETPIAATTAATTTPHSVSSTTSPAAAPEPTSTLRSRHATSSAPKESSAKSTGSNVYPQDPKIATEKTLDDDSAEQEDLTSSLVSMASQLKSHSLAFQETLENEKGSLDRAVLGIDKTSSTMEAAGKRMGMLKRMTEGKGWWGRMMLYAWIFGLWIVAILIVFVGPKLRF